MPVDGVFAAQQVEVSVGNGHGVAIVIGQVDPCQRAESRGHGSHLPVMRIRDALMLG